jgi:hypothetical protein
MYRSKTKAPSHRIEGYRIAIQQVPSCVDVRHGCCSRRHDKGGLYGRPFTYGERIGYCPVLERWEGNGDLRPMLDPFDHLRIPVLVGIPDGHVWDGHSVGWSDVHLGNASVHEDLPAILAFAVDAEAHSSHGPVAPIVIMPEASLEVLEGESLHVTGC